VLDAASTTPYSRQYSSSPALDVRHQVDFDIQSRNESGEWDAGTVPVRQTSADLGYGGSSVSTNESPPYPAMRLQDGCNHDEKKHARQAPRRSLNNGHSNPSNVLFSCIVNQPGSCLECATSARNRSNQDDEEKKEKKPRPTVTNP